MSIDIVKQAIEAFLRSDKYDILVVNGGWGVGKTFLFKTTIATLLKNNQMKSTKYAYVSLFGIDSIKTLKNSIYTDIVLEKEKTTANPKRIKKSIRSMLNHIKELLKHFKVPYIESMRDVVEMIAFSSLKKLIVCLDDIERKSKNIDMDELMGIIREFKEERECKIVIILNENYLENLKDDHIKYIKHLEKLHAINVRLPSSAQYAFDCVFTMDDAPFNDLINNRCVFLKISNIRVVKRIKTYIDDTLKLIAATPESIKENIIESIILFAWARFDEASSGYDYEFFRQVQYFPRRPAFGQEQPDKEIDEMRSFLQEYGFRGLDPISEEIYFYIENGYYRKEFYEELEKKETLIKHYEKKNMLFYLWDYIRGALVLDRDKLLSKIISTCRDCIDVMSPSDLDFIVYVLRFLKEDSAANEIIDTYCEINKENDEKLNLNTNLYELHPIQDKVVLQRLTQCYRDILPEKDPNDALTKIPTHTYDTDDIELVSGLDPDDLYKKLKSFDPITLSKTLTALIRISKTNDRYSKDIKTLVTEILNKFGEESKFNQDIVREIYSIK